MTISGQVHSRSNSNSNSNSVSPPPEKKLKSDNNADKLQARRVKNNRKSRLQSLSKTGEDPIFFDALRFIGQDRLREIVREGQEWCQKFQRGAELQVQILALGAHGEGIALAPTEDWLITVPFVLPGEKVRVRINENERLHSKAELIEILSPNSELRKDELVRCRYFGRCGGCQYQMTAYETQLKLKQQVVERAFSNYSDLPASLIPPILDTLPSPSQYNYRTKLTPHFNLPRSVRRVQKLEKESSKNADPKGKGKGKGKGKQEQLLEQEEKEDEIMNRNKDAFDDLVIGFDTPKGVSLDGKGGNGGVLDIEECVIATKTINASLEGERSKIKDNIKSFKNGSTLLMRDSLSSFDHIGRGEKAGELTESHNLSESDSSDLISNLESITITDHKAPVKESVGKYKFQSNAGSFFQNNRSILPDLIHYVKSQILSISNPDPDSDSGSGSKSGQDLSQERERYLVDAYCGSGLFSICLSDLFKQVSGVEISKDSIQWAERNAESNGITNCQFLAGNAEDIFAKIEYDSQKTTVVIDPPRRGCDEAFINQLVKLGPKDIIYVSCNVHTQARDIGQLIRAAPEYEITSIRGADLFPQTHHVEGIAVLRKRSDGSSSLEQVKDYKGNLSLAKSINQDK